jgi:integrase
VLTASVVASLRHKCRRVAQLVTPNKTNPNNPADLQRTVSSRGVPQSRNNLTNPMFSGHSEAPARCAIFPSSHHDDGPERRTPHAAEVRQVHGRLARRRRPTSPESLQHCSRSNRAQREDARQHKPQAATGIARAVAEYQQAHPKNQNTAAALKTLCAKFGHEAPQQLTRAKVQAVCAEWTNNKQHTRSNYTKALKRFLRWLEEIGQAPASLNRAVPRIYQPAPRTVIATDAERAAMLAAATPRLRFFLLLCADLGLRHKTATRISIANYEPETRSLHFTTKGNTHQSLPVTSGIRAMIEALPRDADPTEPIVNLLRPPKQEGHPPSKNPRFLKAFNKLKAQLGIRAELHIHDLRRTMAEDVWSATRDIRAVQATLGHRSPITTVRYLANRVQLQDLVPVIEKVEAMRAARASNGGQK